MTFKATDLWALAEGVDTAYHKTCLWRETNLNCALHLLLPGVELPS